MLVMILIAVAIIYLVFSFGTSIASKLLTLGLLAGLSFFGSMFSPETTVIVLAAIVAFKLLFKFVKAVATVVFIIAIVPIVLGSLPSSLGGVKTGIEQIYADFTTLRPAAENIAGFLSSQVNGFEALTESFKVQINGVDLTGLLPAAEQIGGLLTGSGECRLVVTNESGVNFRSFTDSKNTASFIRGIANGQSITIDATAQLVTGQDGYQYFRVRINGQEGFIYSGAVRRECN